MTLHFLVENIILHFCFLSKPYSIILTRYSKIFGYMFYSIDFWHPTVNSLTKVATLCHSILFWEQPQLLQPNAGKWSKNRVDIHFKDKQLFSRLCYFIFCTVVIFCKLKKYPQCSSLDNIPLPFHRKNKLHRNNNLKPSSC